jgi:hypothetical protein
LILSLWTLLVSHAWAQQDAPTTLPEAKNLTASLETSRPKIRPGEWFTLAFVVENVSGGSFNIGPPDDGIRGEKALEEQETLLRWETNDSESYDLVPDMLSVQWPRSTPSEAHPKGLLSVPLKIYIPIKATPGGIPGQAEVTFSVSGMDLELKEPFTVTQSVSIQIVHPTDPEATDMIGVNPRLFAEWRGDIPDWTVQDTRVSRPKKGAPTLAWMVFAIPLFVVAIALFWAFATKRM